LGISLFCGRNKRFSFVEKRNKGKIVALNFQQDSWKNPTSWGGGENGDVIWSSIITQKQNAEIVDGKSRMYETQERVNVNIEGQNHAGRLF
jgi:hypothetical protein